jgi:hypothetical protein
MEEVEMIIKIPEEVRLRLVLVNDIQLPSLDTTVASYIQRAIINGTPIERCEKAVSVQDCINAIENTDCELSPQAWKEITTSIMSLPPAIPTRKKGKWIKIGDRGFGVSDTVICKCSECGYKTEFRGKFDGRSLVIDPKHAHKY